jgi:integrase
MRKKIPSGSVYRNTQRDRYGNKYVAETWWLKYYLAGKREPVRICSETDDYDIAVALLKQKMAKAALRVEHREDPDVVRVSQLLDLVIEDYRMARRSSTYDLERRIDKHLRPHFGLKRAKEVTTALIRNYIRSRVSKAAEATINKELAFLRRGFHLGLKNDPPLVERIPYFPMFHLDNEREGIVSYEHYRQVRDSLPSYARIALVIGYHTGARKGEIRKIRIDRIDFNAGRIELAKKTTKNKTARYLPIYGDMRAELDMALSLGKPSCPFLIQDNGVLVFDWEKSWRTACKAAGIEGSLFHDLRRTALTNMIEAGFSEKEAMEISGHKTRYVFDRYHIVSERRMKQLVPKLEAHLEAKKLDYRAMTPGNDKIVRTN